VPESIECFIEYQASSPSYDHMMIWLLPHPSPLLLLESCLFFYLPMCRRSSLLMGEEGGGGGGAKSYDGEKAWSPINHSVLCELYTQKNYLNCNIQYKYSNIPIPFPPATSFHQLIPKSHIIKICGFSRGLLAFAIVFTLCNRGWHFLLFKRKRFLWSTG
jgi:hypothetical protein